MAGNREVVLKHCRQPMSLYEVYYKLFEQERFSGLERSFLVDNSGRRDGRSPGIRFAIGRKISVQ